MTSVSLAVIIPSLDPDEKALGYVNRLIALGFQNIIIVNGGKPKCIVLNHAVNLGKGRAIKTGLNYFLNHYDRSEYLGVVTADSDGQNSPEDTLRVTLKLAENENSLVLGTRDFNGPLVPVKCRKRNKYQVQRRWVFK